MWIDYQNTHAGRQSQRIIRTVGAPLKNPAERCKLRKEARPPLWREFTGEALRPNVRTELAIGDQVLN